MRTGQRALTNALLRCRACAPPAHLAPASQGGKCITVFSAPNYCDMMGNKGAVCKIQAAAGAPPEFLTYTAV